MNPHIVLMHMGFRPDVDYCVHFEAGAHRVEWLSQAVRPTQAQIDAAAPAALAAYNAAEADKAQARADRQELRTQFAAWRDALVVVRDEATWTNVKRDAALKDLARIQIKMLKLIKDMAP